MIPESHIRGDKSRQPKQIPLAQWVPVAHRVTDKIIYRKLRKSVRTVLGSVFVGKISMPNPSNQPPVESCYCFILVPEMTAMSTMTPLPLNWEIGKLWGSDPCFGHVQTYIFEVKPATYTAPRAKRSIGFSVKHPSKWNNFRALIWRLQLLVSPHQTKPCHLMPSPKPPGPEPVRCRKTGPGLGAWSSKLRPKLTGQIQVCNFQRLRSHCHRLPGGKDTALRPHWITLWSTKDHWWT